MTLFFINEVVKDLSWWWEKYSMLILLRDFLVKEVLISDMKDLKEKWYLFRQKFLKNDFVIWSWNGPFFFVRNFWGIMMSFFLVEIVLVLWEIVKKQQRKFIIVILHQGICMISMIYILLKFHFYWNLFLIWDFSFFVCFMKEI